MPLSVKTLFLELNVLYVLSLKQFIVQPYKFIIIELTLAITKAVKLMLADIVKRPLFILAILNLRIFVYRIYFLKKITINECDRALFRYLVKDNIVYVCLF